ncbi:GmrSD restriction endonuclease domain-containing protein, partial [Escherichia coli]
LEVKMTDSNYINNNSLEDTIEIIEEEQNDSYSNDDLYNINSWGADLSFRELITMYDEGELQKPELQRNYVWDKVEASRFIDSLLLGLPVPSIFLANTSDENKLIIDGFQRIMTVYDYVTGIWSKDSRVFKLSDSRKINAKWRGKAFNELTVSEKKKIRSTTIHAIIFEQTVPSNDDTSLYQIFERINTGGRSLMAQEIRNCVYQGKLNTLLIELNNNIKWRTLFGSNKPDARMRDMEFILRGLALNTQKIKSHEPANISLKKLLNEYMGDKANNTSDMIDTIKTDFENTINFIHDNIGPDAFFNIIQSDPSRIRRRFYPTIFDALYVATSIALNSGEDINTNDLEHKRNELLQNQTFRSHITSGTMQIENIHGRISMALEFLYGIQYR